jgi:tRNA A37 threonylcarbamoyltransferase TsaD
LVIDKKGSYDTAVRSFADLINQEAKDGWKFHSMENIAVTQKPGCLAALVGQKEATVYFNMLVFSKE